jgi:hypothetical protein
MSKLKEMLKKMTKEYFDDDPFKSRVSHSISYHTFFQGYSEQKRIGQKGGYHVDRLYTAEYLAFTSDKKKWLLNKLIYSLLYIVAFTLTIMSLSIKSACNEATYVTIPSVCQILTMVVMFIWVVNYAIAPMKMTLGIYATGPKRVKIFAGVAGCCGAVSLLAMVFYFLRHTGRIDSLCTKTLIFEALSVISMAVLYILEKTKKYESIENKNKVPYTANEIW